VPKIIEPPDGQSMTVDEFVAEERKRLSVWAKHVKFMQKGGNNPKRYPGRQSMEDWTWQYTIMSGCEGDDD
jgi:hypothetical protein